MAAAAIPTIPAAPAAPAAPRPAVARREDEKVDLIGSIPFFSVHLACLLAIYTGVRAVDVALCLGIYAIRMFAITPGYHRYFAHRTFSTGRVFQFVLAWFGSTALQKGVLWWAAHHRDHHRNSDTEDDIHSPTVRGFLWSHVGWIICDRYTPTEIDKIRDFARYPELRWLNRWHPIPYIVTFAIPLYLFGGLPSLVVGGFWSCVLLWHGTFTINSLAHVYGRRRYETSDTSRNSLLLALLTFGEGWHNNHHHFPGSANQGFYWWEVDISYYVLRALAAVGLVWDVRTPPARILEEGARADAAARAARLAPRPSAG